MAKIVEQKYSIQEAFRECFYVVPDYQREYVWTEKEVTQLLDDVDEQFDPATRSASQNEYFVGTVLVSPAQDRSHFEIIDGQQRLTTFYLTLCALRERFRGDAQYSLFTDLLSTSYADSKGKLQTSLRLDPRYEYAGDLMKRIVATECDPPSARAKIIAGLPKFGSLEKLLNAYVAVYRWFDENYKSIDELSQYWGYFANNVVFIQISTEVSNAP